MKSGNNSPATKPVKADVSAPAAITDAKAPATKMERATALYSKLLADDPHIPRKDIIDEFVKHCELTPAGAATYYSTIKKRVSSKKS
ncbi:hypothetical protein [Rheinheimera sp.]|uniref:hypothetical protein n=1 Tax=Rheinheimera sp. TaxID=1869214 RepID=UPI0027330842|nr:hypothetical protein [Rheinheimera sp.]MDP2716492.1 hypothetical protein [Rheinheimera sp.]